MRDLYSAKGCLLLSFLFPFLYICFVVDAGFFVVFSFLFKIDDVAVTLIVDGT